MTQSDNAAVHVVPVAVDAEAALGEDTGRCEGLVNLEQIDIRSGEPAPVEQRYLMVSCQVY